MTFTARVRAPRRQRAALRRILVVNGWRVVRFGIADLDVTALSPSGACELATASDVWEVTDLDDLRRQTGTSGTSTGAAWVPHNPDASRRAQ